MKILAITTMRNEGPHCLEWFAHHKAIGVEHFLVYSNGCDDGTDLILDALAKAGIVSHVRLATEGKKSLQWRAFNHASDLELYKAADWVLVADCDEFTNLRKPLTGLPQLIESLPNPVDAMAIPWRLFGNSGHVQMPKGLTTEHFVNAAPLGINLPLAHFFKSMFRPRAFRQIGVHRPKKRNNTNPVWVDGGGNLLPENFGEQDNRINLYGLPVSSDIVQLNHYSLRSAENFMVKRARGLPNHMDREIGLGYWVERNFNSVPDSTIHTMLPGTRRELNKLLKIPGIAELRQSAVVWHGDKFNALMLDRKEVQLFWQISLCTGSHPPSVELATAQIKRITAIQQN
ncbi:MAG: glycosyltransferase family 2 protein [Paracoccaceae bacterium]